MRERIRQRRTRERGRSMCLIVECMVRMQRAANCRGIICGKELIDDAFSVCHIDIRFVNQSHIARNHAGESLVLRSEKQCRTERQ